MCKSQPNSEHPRQDGLRPQVPPVQGPSTKRHQSKDIAQLRDVELRVGGSSSIIARAPYGHPRACHSDGESKYH